MSDTKINAWKKAVEQGSLTQRCDNIITTSPNAHVYWDAGLYALKPIEISDDQKTMNVQLFWLPVVSPEEVMTTPPVLPSGVDTPPGRNVKFFDCVTCEVIVSGHTFTFSTDDPTTKPLSSWDMIEAQWLVRRLFALSIDWYFEGY